MSGIRSCQSYAEPPPTTATASCGSFVFPRQPPSAPHCRCLGCFPGFFSDAQVSPYIKCEKAKWFPVQMCNQQGSGYPTTPVLPDSTVENYQCN